MEDITKLIEEYEDLTSAIVVYDVTNNKYCISTPEEFIAFNTPEDFKAVLIYNLEELRKEI